MKFIKFLVLICAISVASLSSAQIVNKGKEKADSLALNLDLPDRIAFRTNFVDWVLTTPNIGVEIDLGNKTYNHWTVGFNVRGNWNTSHTFNPGVVYNISGARADVRYYYRMRKIGAYGEVAGEGSGAYPHAPKGLLNKLFSCRREEPKHPDITYYRGLYASYNKFSIKLGDEGKQGSAFTLGFTWGFIKPLYVFKSGNSMDLEMGISAGVAYAQYDKYKHDRESNCYPVVGTEDWGVVPHPVLSDLRVGLVYRLGNTTVKEKYAWRYDVDQAYRDSLNKMMKEKYNAELKNREGKYHKENGLSILFSTYDIAADHNKQEKQVADSIAEVEAKVAKAEKKAKARIKITFDKNKVKIVEGESLTLSYKIVSDTIANKTVKWTTSDDTVAIVNNGIVTGVKPGKAIITAVFEGKKAECEVEVKEVKTDIRIGLEPAKAKVIEGESLTLKYKIAPDTIANKIVEWTSSDESVAIVTNGIVTAIKPGKVIVTVTCEGKKAECKIEVKEAKKEKTEETEKNDKEEKEADNE